jgi:hypothetical protein
MKALFELARDLCWLRRGPQDVPHSRILCGGLFALAVLADLILAGVVLHEPSTVQRVALADALMAGLPYVALSLAGREARWLQTIGALSLVSIVFTVLMTPVLVVQGPADPNVAATPLQLLAAWVWLALLAWQILVQGHVLRSALELRLPLGVLIALAFFVAGVSVDLALFPHQP